MFGSEGVGADGSECMRGLGLGFTNPGERGEMWDMCLCLGCGGVSGAGGMGVMSQGLEGWGWCYVC